MPTTMRERNVHDTTGIRGDAPRLLFVEDDADVLATYRTRFRKYEVDVFDAPSGRDGLQLARDVQPDVIVTDVCMARGDGDYLVGKLKRRSQTNRIPIIVISGVDDPDLALRMYKAGVNRFLRKPVPFDEMVREINRYVGLEVRRTLVEPSPVAQPRFTSAGSLGRRFRIDPYHGPECRRRV